MASDKTKSAIVIGAVALVVILILGGIAFFILKVHAQAVKERELAQLKQDNPVEYQILHTPLTMNENDLKAAMVGTWQLVGTKSGRTGDFTVLMSPWSFHKMFTLTNWEIVTYDNDSNVLYSASGHYELRGENYTESIEEATGMMTKYLGKHPKFKIRMDGDKFYQMGAGKNPSIEEMWQRVE